MINSLIHKMMVLGLFLGAAGMARAERPFAAESYCFAEQRAVNGDLRGVYALLEKTHEGEWVYALMSSIDNETFEIFDGGNTCILKVVGVERRFECSNLETEQITVLATELKINTLAFSSDREIKLADYNNDKQSVQLARGERSFSLQDLSVCTKGL